MNTITREAFDEMLQQITIKSRLKNELKFITSTAHMPADWSEYELVAIADRTGNKGVLLLQPADLLYIAPYDLSRKIVDAKTGRSRAIICDFCYTWQPGSNAASITFTHSITKHTIGFLCCGDLACSQHVRTATKASIVSRTQLREHMSNEDRATRLKERLMDKINQLQLQPVSTSLKGASQ